MNLLRALKRLREDGIQITLERVHHRLRGRVRRNAQIQRIANEGRSGGSYETAFARALGVPEKDLGSQVAILDAELCASALPGNDPAWIADQLKREMPHQVDEVIERAKAITRGDMRWLGHGLPDFQGVIDWHVALGAGENAQWPLLPIDQIHEAAENTPGDIRQTWELNRHQPLLFLPMAFLFTGDPQHLEALQELLRSWMDANPWGRGIHWMHAQETALRMKSWVWARRLAGDHMPWTETERTRFHAALWAHADHAWSTRTTSPDRNNHALTEILALDGYCASMPSSPLARQHGPEIHLAAEAEILRQFWEDGSPGEGSVGYHLFTLESATEWATLRRTRGLHTSERVLQRLDAMTGFAAAMIRPDGSWPRIGDVDDGLGMLLQPTPEDRRDPLTAACRAFGVAPPSSSRGSMTCWWLGLQAAEDEEEKQRPSHTTSRFLQTGLAVDRIHLERSSHLVFCAGPSAFRRGVSLAHLHADSPSMTWWVEGQTVLTDAGTGCYGGLLSDRTRYRETAAHSSLQVDGADRFDVTSLRFGVERPPESSPVQLFAGDGWTLFESQLPAARSGPTAPLRLTRRVLHLPSLPALLILDRCTGEGSHDLRRSLHFGDLSLTLKEDMATLHNADGHLIFQVSSDPSTTFHAVRAPRSPRYGVHETGASLRLETPRASLPWNGSLLLAPPQYTMDWKGLEKCTIMQAGHALLSVLLQDEQPYAVEWVGNQ